MYSPLLLIVVPFLMSVAVMLFFRKVDRERFHLSKIKRFTQSILDQFSGTVRDKEKEVRASILELEEISNKAKLLGDHLKGQIELVNDRVSSLQNKGGVFYKLDKGARQLEALNSRIEGNIAILEKDDNVIAVLNKDIKALEKNVLNSSAKLSSLEEKLIKDSNDKILESRKSFLLELDNLSEKVEDRAKEGLEIFDERINVLVEQHLSKMYALEDKFNLLSSSMDRTELEVVSFKDKLFEDADSKYQDMLVRLSGLDEKYGEQTALFADRVSNIENTFKKDTAEYISSVERKIDSFSLFFEQMDKVIAEFRAKFNTELSAKIALIDEDANKKVEYLKSNMQSINNQIAEFMEVPANTINNYMSELTKSIDKQKQALESRITDMDAKVINLGSNLKERFNKDIEQLVYMVEEERRTVTKQANNINVYLDNFMETEKARITKELSGHFNSTFNEQKELSRNISILSKDSADLKKEIDGSRAKLIDDIQTANSTLRDTIKTNLEDLYYKIEDQKKNSDKIYENVQNNIDNMQLSVRDRLLTEAASISSTIEEKKAEISLFYENNKNVVKDKNKELDYMISGIKDFYNAELEKIIQVIKGNYDKVEQEYIFNNTRLLRNTELQVKEVAKELGSLQDKFRVLLDSSSNGIEDQAESYKRDLANFIETLRQRMQEKEDKIISRINDKAGNINNDIAVLENQISKVRSETFNDIGVYKTQLQSEFDALISPFKTRISNLNQELENKVSVKTEKIMVGVRAMVNELQSELNTRIKSYIEKAQAKVSSFDNEVRRINDYDISMEEFNNKFDIELKRLENELTNLKDKLSFSTKEEFKKVSSELKIIDERIGAFAKESKLFKKADKFYDKLKEEIHYANEQIKRIRDEREYFSDFDTKVDMALQSKEQLNLAMSNAENKKQELYDVVTRMETVAGMKDDIDRKIFEVQKSLKSVENIEAKLEAFKSAYATTKGSVAELKHIDSEAKKSLSLLKDGREYIDGAHRYVQGIKHDIKGFYNKSSELKGSISDIEKRLSFIEGAEDKIKEVMKRFDQMDSFVVDLEKRTNQIDIARERVLEAENVLERLHNTTDTKILTLKQLVKGNGSNNLSMDAAYRSSAPANSTTSSASSSTGVTSSVSHGVNPSGVLNTSLVEDNSNIATLHKSTLSNENRQEAVIKLYEKGFDIERISTLLNLSKSEVKLVIDVDKSKI